MRHHATSCDREWKRVGSGWRKTSFVRRRCRRETRWRERKRKTSGRQKRKGFPLHERPLQCTCPELVINPGITLTLFRRPLNRHPHCPNYSLIMLVLRVHFGWRGIPETKYAATTTISNTTATASTATATPVGNLFESAGAKEVQAQMARAEICLWNSSRISMSCRVSCKSLFAFCLTRID